MAEQMFLDAVASASTALAEKDYRRAIMAAEKARDNFEIDYDCNEDVQDAAGKLGEISCEALSMIGKSEEAIQQGLSNIRMFPHRYEGPLVLARAYQRARQLEEARQWCGKAYSLNPKSSTVRISMKSIETDIKIEQSNTLNANRMIAASPHASSVSITSGAETPVNSFRANGVVPVLSNTARLASPRRSGTPVLGNGASSSSFHLTSSRSIASPISAITPLRRIAPVFKAPVVQPEEAAPVVAQPLLVEAKPARFVPSFGLMVASALASIVAIVSMISGLHYSLGPSATFIAIPLEVFTSTLLTCSVLAVAWQVRSSLLLERAQPPAAAHEDKRRLSTVSLASSDQPTKPEDPFPSKPSGTGSVTLRAPKTLQRRLVAH